MNAVVEHGTAASRTGIEVMPEDVERVGAGIDTVCPTFEPGDALLFDELLLHLDTDLSAHLRRHPRVAQLADLRDIGFR